LAQPAGDAPLPPIDPVEIDAMVDFLLSREKSQRRPEASAKLLILVCKLHKDRTPWPTRPAVAKHLDVSLPLVDRAISQRRAQRLIKVVIETTQGFVKQRQSVITHRFIEPSEDLWTAYEKAQLLLAEGVTRAEVARRVVGHRSKRRRVARSS
jgi:hypothetical protein